MDRPGGHITPGEVSQSRKDKHCDSTVPGSAVVRFMQKGSRTEVAVAVCVCVCNGVSVLQNQKGPVAQRCEDVNTSELSTQKWLGC